MPYPILAIEQENCEEPKKVISSDVLAIKQKWLDISLKNLDLKEEYLKPEPVERTMDL